MKERYGYAFSPKNSRLKAYIEKDLVMIEP
jgi:hypothetical protein